MIMAHYARLYNRTIRFWAKNEDGPVKNTRYQQDSANVGAEGGLKCVKSAVFAKCCGIILMVLLFIGCSDDTTIIQNKYKPHKFEICPPETVYVAMPPHELLKRLQCYEEWFEDYPLHPGRDCKPRPECLR